MGCILCKCLYPSSDFPFKTYHNIVQDGDDKEEDEEKETDKDGFFVPHGYLSDDEGIEEENDGSDVEDDNPDKPPPSGSGDLNVRSFFLASL